MCIHFRKNVSQYLIIVDKVKPKCYYIIPQSFKYILYEKDRQREKEKSFVISKLDGKKVIFRDYFEHWKHLRDCKK